MQLKPNRREFLAHGSMAALGTCLPGVLRAGTVFGQSEGSKAQVAIARDSALLSGRPDDHRELLCKMLNASLQRLTGEPSAPEAWRTLFSKKSRVGIKVNTLGLSTQPAVVDAVVSGLRSADVPAENILIWDRFDVELGSAGFKLNKSGHGVRCRGTDAESIGSGYQQEIESSGTIGSCFSRIVAEEVDALICMPVLKDHNLAGVSLGMKNFFGAIHNPNKYHDQNCDPYVADVAAHRFIRPKWRLTVCDGTRAQVHAGPGYHPGFAWTFGGIIVGTDFVAADAVAAELLDAQRVERGLKTLADEGRPARHIATAGVRGLGVADLPRIERLEV